MDVIVGRVAPVCFGTEVMVLGKVCYLQATVLIGIMIILLSMDLCRVDNDFGHHRHLMADSSH